MSRREWTSPDGRIRLINADCLGVLPELFCDRCSACGHEWRMHLNTNACCQVVGKDDSTEFFEGATRYCLCEELPPPSVDSVVTDPPYGIKRTNHGGFLESRGMLANDDSQEAGQAVLDWCEKYALPTAAFASPRKPWAGKWRNLIVWDKGGAVAGGGDLRTCLKLSWELIQVARNGALSGSRDDSVWRRAVVQQDFANHPTEKPADLVERLLRTLFSESRVVLDPFMGSGTTGVACIRTGKRFVGIELNRDYFDIAVRRIEAELNRAPLFEPAPAVQRSLIAEAVA